MQSRRQTVVVEGRNHFDQPGHTGGGLGMTDVGFDRAQPQRVISISGSTVGGDQGTGLDRVTQRGAGAMGLDHIHLIKPDTGVGHRLSDHPLLSGPVRGGQPIRSAILVDRRSRDDRQHRMLLR